jgi:hypothetical protein
MSSPETPTPVTTTRRATRGTSYSPAYGAEACLPPETLLDSPRVQSFDKFVQERSWRKDVDSIDKRRWQAAIRNAHARECRQRFVHSRELRVRDLVLRQVPNRGGLHKLS